MIYLKLKNLQPLCVSSEAAQGNIRPTLDYIPGGTLRGALAAHLNATHPDMSSERLHALLLDDQLRFRNLYPLASSDDQDSNGRDSYPLPQTARACKLFGGFKTNDSEHGVEDGLLPLLRYRLGGETAVLPHRLCTHKDCDLPLEPFSGFYANAPKVNYQQVQPSKRFVTQTAIDPRREAVRPSNLFTVEVLDEGQTFAGYISLANEADEQWFSEQVCATGTTLRIGYGRTRGMGLMEIIDYEITPQGYWEEMPLEKRISIFNEQAQTLNCPIPQGHTLFSITLLSDTILRDPHFRYLQNISQDVLAQEIDPKLANSVHQATFASTRTIAGWSSPQKLPRPMARALTVGSVFVFQTPLSIDELVSVLQETAVETHGIGERREEGFGQLVVCHPFHQEVATL